MSDEQTSADASRADFLSSVPLFAGIPEPDLAELGHLLRRREFAAGEVLWREGEPDWAAACRSPAVKLHLYGKATPRPGRKMGHLTALAATPAEALAAVTAARSVLTPAQSVRTR